ncbi:MAG: hypothetical protein LCH87_08140 [Actinobacteria bacterium]|uniref:hypothetical protein n=1 Tax=Propionicimonas sp. T2.31MG-18 TaxID=3157620 RepID=UPI0035EAC785|nr:hypothetical protein [Actinomycetota bacterium]
MAKRKNKRDGDEGTRDQLLRAGFDMLSSGTALSSIKLLDLTKAAAVSNGSFYHAWPEGLGAYQRDLAIHAVDLAQVEYLKFIEESVIVADPGEIALRDLVMTQCKQDAEGIDHDPSFIAQVSLWGEHKQHPGVLEALRNQYNRFAEKLYLPMYGRALEVYGLELREPFNMGTLATMMTALAEGLALRRAVDPEVASLPKEVEAEGWDLYGILAYCLLSVMLRPVNNGDTRTAVQLADDLLLEGVPDAAAKARAAEAAAFRDDLDAAIAAIETQLEQLRSLRSRRH